MRIKFLDDYNLTPMGDRRTTTKYRKGMEATVKREDGELAVLRGVAEEIDVPQRSADSTKAVNLAGKAQKAQAD